MKNCFIEADVNTANFISGEIGLENIIDWVSKYPIVGKHRNGSRGNGNYKFDSENELVKWAASKNLSRYIFEDFVNYTREYRLHVTIDGCFYACRKMKRRDAPENWQRHSNNCVWILEENELFNKPTTWSTIVEHCVRALQVVGLTVGAFDVMVAKDGRFVLLEVNSAPSFGDNPETSVVRQKYIEMLTNIDSFFSF